MRKRFGTLYHSRLLGLHAFFVSFLVFDFQILSVKILEFLKYDVHFFDKFVAPLYGIAFGAFIYSIYRWPRTALLRLLSLLLIAFVFNIIFGWRSLFLPFLYLIFIIFGAVLLEALSALTVRRALIIDTLGGICGLGFAFFSMKWISIELQIFIMAVIILFFLFLDEKKLGDIILITVVLICIFDHVSNDSFNFIRAREIIPSRYGWLQGTINNGQYAVSRSDGEYLGAKWTEFDRVDLIKRQDGNLQAYLNNELFMGYSQGGGRLVPSYGKTLHILGFGLGEQINSLSESNYKHIVGSEINSHLYNLARENLKNFKGPTLRLQNEDGFLLSEDYPDYFDLVFAVFPSAIANYSSLTKSGSSDISMEAYQQMYKSLNKNGLLVTALNVYHNRELNLSGVSTIYEFMRLNGLDSAKHLAVLYLPYKEKLRIFYIIKRGEIVDNDLQSFYDWQPNFCKLNQCRNISEIINYESETKDVMGLIKKFSPYSNNRLVFKIRNNLLSFTSWTILIILSCIGLIIVFQNKILFSYAKVGIFPFLSGSLAAIFQLFLNGVYVFLFKLPVISYMVVSFLFLIGGGYWIFIVVSL
ncbi:MAG: hypothetical protein IT287_07960 [Bdellovibrionaceae bacterium]|nr:hypothetical protein [Pseudobdellovibrionaceae bacterium]